MNTTTTSQLITGQWHATSTIELEDGQTFTDGATGDTRDNAELDSLAIVARQAVLYRHTTPQLARHAGFTGDQIREMREWLLDNDWGEEDAAEYISEATPHEIVRAIEAHYHGGTRSFILAL